MWKYTIIYIRRSKLNLQCHISRLSENKLQEQKKRSKKFAKINKALKFTLFILQFICEIFQFHPCLHAVLSISTKFQHFSSLLTFCLCKLNPISSGGGGDVRWTTPTMYFLTPQVMLKLLTYDCNGLHSVESLNGNPALNIH